MPELPEVETTKISILSHLTKQRVKKLVVRQPILRWPVSNKLMQELPGAIIKNILRRGKYLLVITNQGTLLIHLGMSGHLRILQQSKPPTKHDHIDMHLYNGKILRFTDPRRFGCWLWTTTDPYQHNLLKNLGPEPLTNTFTADYLYRQSRNRKISVKVFIMNNQVVVGVGNIYASEALFLAGIHPEKLANSLTKKQCSKLVDCIKQVLTLALTVGGTTIRNFMHGENEGKPGYFKQLLWVYGRHQQSCKKCNGDLQLIKIGQRSSVFCPGCQKR